jgi:hypothetical protein
MQLIVKKVVCVAELSQYISEVCERNAQSSQTLITSPSCLFQPFTYMEYYGYSWVFMGIHGIVYPQAIFLRSIL